MDPSIDPMLKAGRGDVIVSGKFSGTHCTKWLLRIYLFFSYLIYFYSLTFFHTSCATQRVKEMEQSILVVCKSYTWCVWCRGRIIHNHNKWLWQLMLFELKHTNCLNTAMYTHWLQRSSQTKSFCSIGSQFTRVCFHFSLKTGNKTNAPQLWPCSWENYMWHQPSCVSQPINCEFHKPRAMTNCMNLWL